MPEVRKVIFKCEQPPGDLLMLSAAIRDLHFHYPGQFVTDVRTSNSELWENNPNITPLDEKDPEIEVCVPHYPLINQTGKSPVHFLNGYIDFLNQYFQLEIRLSEFRGAIYLSEKELSGPSPVEELVGTPIRYWIVNAGGKYDFTVKWWHTHYYQEVADHFAGRIPFAQIGAKGDFHPPLERVLDFRRKTQIRDLIRLVYHADGVVCPITFLMHLTAAVPVNKNKSRGCIVVAGGREPPSWPSYPNHRFLHSIGTLPCCRDSGCWKSRTLALRDGTEQDKPEHRCELVGKNGHAMCMNAITPSRVIEEIESIYRNEVIPRPSVNAFKAAEPFLTTPLIPSGHKKTIYNEQLLVST